MFSSLKNKMIFPVVGLVILMFLFTFVYTSIATTDLVDRLSDERIAGASRSVSLWLDNFENQTRTIAMSIASHDTIVTNLRNWNANLNRAESRQILVPYLLSIAAELGIDSLVLRDAEGRIIVRLHDLETYNDIDGSASAVAALRGEITTSYSSTPTMPLGLNTTAPIWHEGEIIGIIAPLYFLDTAEFVDYFAGIFEARVTIFAGNTSVMTSVVEPDGTRTVGHQLVPEVIDIVVNQRRSFLTEITLAGDPYHAYYMPVTGLAGNYVGLIFLGFSDRQTVDATNAMRRNLILIGIAGLGVIVLVIFIVITKMLKPLDLLKNNLNNIANGDGDLTITLPATGSDEIAEVSRYFNMTIGKIRNLIISIKRQAETLSDIGNNLSGNMKETAAAMNEITSNIQIVKSRVINQSASVTQTNATMRQVTTSIDKLNGSVEHQIDAVSLSSSAVEEMIANIHSVTSTLAKNAETVKELQESSNTGRSSIQEVTQDIQEITRESEGLLEINSVMESIASQTNLLSMNAAIEAAHAGDAGKGFAVVAGEIRKLAESSSEQSKIIGNVLKKIKTSIDKITRSTDNVLNRFEAIDHRVKTVAEQDENIRNAMEEQSQGSKQILQASQQVNNITQEVKGGSVQMLEGSKEVITESENLEMVTTEITNGMNEMSSSAEQVNTAVTAVNKLSDRTRENIAALSQAVSQFKI